MRMNGFTVTSLLLLSLTACGSMRRPEALTSRKCTVENSAGSSEELSGLLRGAEAGSCVTLGSNTFEGSFVVPAGVALMAGEGKTPFLNALPDQKAPVVVLEGGEGSLLYGLAINAVAGPALQLQGGGSLVLDCRIGSERDLAVVAICAASGCDKQPITLQGNQIGPAANGLLADGVQLEMQGNTLSDIDGTKLNQSLGMVVTGGATLHSSGDIVTRSGEAGIIINGATTQAHFEGLTVTMVKGRGLWGQGLRGEQAVPALELGGAKNLFEDNALVGFGVTDSVGIIVGTAIVRNTKAVSVPTGNGSEEIGDGVGVFNQSSDVEFKGDVELRDNARAQLLIDQGGVGIIVGTAIVDPGKGLYGIVIQGTAASDVTMGAGQQPSDPGQALGVADQSLAMPGA